MKLVKILAISAVISLNSACDWDGGPVVISDTDHDFRVGGAVSDSEPLSVQVRRKLKNNGQTVTARINVSQPDEDTVRLTGIVDNAGVRDEAERLASQVEGVRFVVNNLTID